MLSGRLGMLKGREFYGEFLAKTDPLGANVPNPVSHIAYGYATQMYILDPETGRIEKLVAAHDVGKAINPKLCLSCGMCVSRCVRAAVGRRR